MWQPQITDGRRIEYYKGTLLSWLENRSIGVVNFFHSRMESIITYWLVTMLLFALAKVAIAANDKTQFASLAAMIFPFLAVTMAPVVAYRIATACFPLRDLASQPSFRLCRYGQWRQLDCLQARKTTAFGPTGFMASLIAGMLLNVPFRTAEFMLAMPAMPASAPAWATTMLAMMTMDVVVLNFFYTVCFVMALRTAPLFPRMLAFTWLLDVMMQLQIAEKVTQTGNLPASVATALHSMLSGDLDKVLISAAIWLPYLILSERVNVTFRHRTRAKPAAIAA
ncbi:DUF2569 family protein [Novosphingobium sp. KN65.2]|uniref:DUF2569 family protein n=1 Tax=Novosphingobium sp. KN65.2 TaxID=1478134 RepID=UPI0005DDFC08|nr:DUF2569 family protein [Novosphingobium sp. KN65.2]CDO38264.1 conserved membrane hypothetical protein [Novosphingobium sp. KN65.2]